MKKYLPAYKQAVVCEFIKLRTTFAFWLSIIYPLGSTFLVTLFWISTRNNKVVNTNLFINNLCDVSSFFLPFFVVLMISVSCYTEHKTSMLKHLLALPVPRPVIYLGKFSGIMVFVFLAFILTLTLAYTSIITCGLFLPRLGLGDSFNHLLLLQKLARAYFAAPAIYSIQYWLGMRMRNLTLPVAIGSALIILPIAVLIVMGITGLITKIENFTKIVTYNPYSYPYSTAFNIVKTTDVEVFPTTTIVFLTIALLMLIFGSMNFKTWNVK